MTQDKTIKVKFSFDRFLELRQEQDRFGFYSFPKKNSFEKYLKNNKIKKYFITMTGKTTNKELYVVFKNTIPEEELLLFSLRWG